MSIDDGPELMRGWMARYAGLPCDFADASLLYAAWQTEVREIWTVDLDFTVYRLPDRSRFTVIPGGKKSAKPKNGAKRKVAPKYRDPQSGATWSGRGLTPKWLVEKEKAGAKREEFLIKRK